MLQYTEEDELLCDKCGKVVQPNTKPVTFTVNSNGKYDGESFCNQWNLGLVIFCEPCWPDKSVNDENYELAAKLIAERRPYPY